MPPLISESAFFTEWRSWLSRMRAMLCSSAPFLHCARMPCTLFSLTPYSVSSSFSCMRVCCRPWIVAELAMSCTWSTKAVSCALRRDLFALRKSRSSVMSQSGSQRHPNWSLLAPRDSMKISMTSAHLNGCGVNSNAASALLHVFGLQYGANESGLYLMSTPQFHAIAPPTSM